MRTIKSTRKWTTLGVGICLASLATVTLAAPLPEKMSVQDLLAVKWISQVTISPSGKQIAFVVSEADYAANRRNSQIYISASDGNGLRQLTNALGSNSQPVFSPDGKQIAFISSRGGGEPQIWLVPTDGGEAKQLTQMSNGADGPLWSPNGKYLAFVSSIFPDCADEKCNAKRTQAREASKVKAQVFDQLLYRHWNHFRDERRSHIFLFSLADKSLRDLTPGSADAPPVDLGGSPDYSFSPDGKYLAYTTNLDSVVATSTNNDVYEIALSEGQAKPRQVSLGKGNDSTPRYSPDGRFLAYLSMASPGYEADRPRIIVRERSTGKETEWSVKYDGHPLGLLWSPDSQALYFTAPHRGYTEIFAARADGIKKISDRRFAKYLNVTPDGRRFIFTDEAAHRPPEVFSLDTDGKNVKQFTQYNTWLTKKVGLTSAEDHWFTGAADEKVHALLLKPPGFIPGRKYPALVMVHGGPQEQTGNSFHPRWNLAMFAAAGYVVFGINFHGSLGFGQAFTSSISGDWGGKPYTDILKGTDYLATLSFIQKEKICASGASYGGYMANWLATHTKRFQCLISHAGVYNLESKYGSTEELWFPEWEIKGTPWTNREAYRRWSPHSYAENLHTPTLVIHGQLDYRVPVEQGMQLFTALKRQGIPSRFLYFPDEDHFVQKPQNIELWWKTMRDWLSRYLKK